MDPSSGNHANVNYLPLDPGALTSTLPYLSPRAQEAQSTTLSGFLTNSQQVEVSQSTFHAQTHNAPVVHIHNYPSGHPPEGRTLRDEASRNLNDAFLTSGGTRQAQESWFNERSVGNLPIEASSTIYERHFIRKGRGFPLWIPRLDVSFPIPYRTKGVSIGDVGIITEGSFHFLFNILLPSNDPINADGVPHDFQPLQPTIHSRGIQRIQVFSGGDYLSSQDISRTTYTGDSSSYALNPVHVSSKLTITLIFGKNSHTFISSASDGAILTMPEPVFHERLLCLTVFEKYIKANAESWYNYANGVVHLGVGNGDLYLVSAVDKTSAWGMATFLSTSHHSDITLNFRTVHQEMGQPVYVWEHSGSVDSKTGPDTNERTELQVAEGQPLSNQCLFVRTISVMIGQKSWRDLENSNFGSSDSAQDGFQESSDSAGTDVTGGARSGSASSGPSVSAQGFGGSERSESTISLTEDTILTNEMPTGLRNIHPSKLLNELLLKEVPNAKMAISSDRDWDWMLHSAHPNEYDTAEKFIKKIGCMRTIVDDDGVVCLEPAVWSDEGEDDEFEDINNILNGFEDGSTTIEDYIFGFNRPSNRKALLDKLVMDLSSRSLMTWHDISDAQTGGLQGHPDRLLSLYEISQHKRGNTSLLHFGQSIQTAHKVLDSLPMGHTHTPAIMCALAGLFFKRYRRFSFRYDLDEAIWYYEGALGLNQGEEYTRLEALLGLCSALYRRLKSFGDLKDAVDLCNRLQEQGRLDFDKILLAFDQDLQRRNSAPDILGLPTMDSLSALSHFDSSDFTAALPLPSHQETEKYLRKTLEVPYPYPLNLSSLPDEPFDKKAPAVTTLIKLAIFGSKDKRLTLRQIYDEIENRYPSWKDAKDKHWQTSIRHNLSLKAIFVPIERLVSHPGKSFYWALDVRQGEGNKHDGGHSDGELDESDHVVSTGE
ncbi:hypothetical protein NLJ89_g2926 [Agrocybe chaxingu]|uniref:Fork-head domain-containing protein n=1 Tax=Agrocybe chaxingu TaxID=84603 RepID=A0A9W8KBR6_9AGAR|nr:hypothetical protein NLJ89_g2926 [Agrocybe chaxingu]